MAKHPQQPVELVDGVVRFKMNKIVRAMLDMGGQGMKFDLNTLHRMNFSAEDHVQLVQLIGYSVDGASDLSFVPNNVIRNAKKKVKKLLEK